MGNNAGVSGRGLIEDTTEEEWDRVMDTNTKGTFLGIKAALPALKKSDGASIINISSVAGLIGSRYTAYGASKGAVRLLTKSTAVEYGPVGIRCNSVHPGIIATDMTKNMLTTDDDVQYQIDRTPLEYIPNARDVSYGVLFLASDESRYVTGSELVIDGGITAK